MSYLVPLIVVVFSTHQVIRVLLSGECKLSVFESLIIASKIPRLIAAIPAALILNVTLGDP